MKQLEQLLGIVSTLLFALTGIVAAMWVGVVLISWFGSDPESVSNTGGPAQAAALSEDPPAAAPSTPPATAPVVATASLEQGEKVFKKCKACHSVDEGGAHKTGPNLWSVVGRSIGSADGFEFSDAMVARTADTWTVDNLMAYLADPKAFIPGNKMSFGGLRKEGDLQSVILFLSQNSATPRDAAALGFAAPAADAVSPSVTEEAAVAEEVVELDEIPYPEGVTYANPSAPSEEDRQEIATLVAALEGLAPTLDYERARFHPIHFPPAINDASNEECLVCHQEIMTRKPLEESPAGVPAEATLAWYQTLDTYAGDQESFHYRHLQSDFAQQVMNLDCVFCHKGNDPREETPDMLRTRPAFSASASPEFTLRKMVNPSTTCLRCHGTFPYEVMSLEGPWHEIREDMEWPEAPNGCLSCHAETFRTNRHAVTYLNAENIEELARNGSADTCYGCHGGRAWYRISYPYPRHAWPDMDEDTPEWAMDRPTVSDPEYALPATAE